MQMPPLALAVRLTAHGDPGQVLRVESVAPVPPGPGQVLLRMRLAPINPADLNVIEGTYGRLPTLPATPGNEGLGEVVALGQGVTGFALGDLARPRDGIGTWCQWCTADAARCLRIPAGLPDEQAAQLTINPGTAWAVLREFPTGPSGSWILLNAPTSAVGRSLLVLAARRGLRVLALVRREDEIETVRALGASEVVVEGREASKNIRQICGPAAFLALNQVGGDSATTLAKSLAPQGTMVTIGALARQPLTMPNAAMIFNELRCCGFWVSRWYERSDPAVVAAMIDEVAGLMSEGSLHLPVASQHPLEQVAEAVVAARTAGRRGKVLLRCA
jgi:NADPH:quinone reductase-like Zn-dependent oxidoreductase